MAEEIEVKANGVDAMDVEDDDRDADDDDDGEGEEREQQEEDEDEELDEDAVLLGPEVETVMGTDKVAAQTPGYVREKSAVEAYPYVLYPVKVLRVDASRKDAPFKVHFHGWKSRYDRWVDTVLEDTPETRVRSKQLKQLVQEAVQAAKLMEARRSARLRRESSGTSLRKRKRGRDAGELADEAAADTELHDGQTALEAAAEGILRLSIPIPLKRALIDDFERVTQRRALVRLPKKHSVHNILQEFCKHACQPMGLASSVGKVTEEDLKATVDGLAILFERAIETSLLYEFELLQYDAIREQNPAHEDDHLVAKPNAVRNVKGKRLVHIYGAEHLLRYIYNLPELLRTSELLPGEIDLYRRILNGLLRFVSKNRDRYLASDGYVEASSEYVAVLQDFKPFKLDEGEGGSAKA